MDGAMKNAVLSVGILVTCGVLLSACMTTDISTVSKIGPVVERLVDYDKDDFDSAADAFAWLETRDRTLTSMGSNNGVIEPRVFYRQKDDAGNWIDVVKDGNGNFVPIEKDAKGAATLQSQDEQEHGGQ